MSSTIHPFALTLVGFIAGMKKHYAGQSIMLDGKPWAVDALEAFFQSAVDATDGAADATVAKTTAVKKARDAVAQVRPVARAFKKAVLAAYGADPTALADFELTAPKQTVKTPAIKDAAAKKALATRKALGTKGPKQKAKARKDLEATQAAAPAAPAAPEAAPVAAAAATLNKS